MHVNTFYFVMSYTETSSYQVVVYSLHRDLKILGMDLLGMDLLDMDLLDMGPLGHSLNSCLCCNMNLSSMDPWHRGLSFLMVDSLV